MKTIMSAVRKRDLISIDEYLAGERESPVRHEFLGGMVYAMAGARVQHDLIAGNIFAQLHARLRGRSCRPHTSDMKIRVRLPTQTRFYYPDVSVVCKSNPPGESYQDQPSVLFEVLSISTRRIDEGEKKDAYLTIPSLGAYVLVEQDTSRVVIYRRSEQGFVAELYEGPGAVIPFAELDVELPLAEIYQNVEFVPEAEDDSLR